MRRGTEQAISVEYLLNGVKFCANRAGNPVEWANEMSGTKSTQKSFRMSAERSSTYHEKLARESYMREPAIKNNISSEHSAPAGPVCLSSFASMPSSSLSALTVLYFFLHSLSLSPSVFAPAPVPRKLYFPTAISHPHTAWPKLSPPSRPAS